MDIYQIFTTYTGTWTEREIICFLVVFSGVCAVEYGLLRQGRIIWLQAMAGLLMTVFLGIVFGSTVFTRMPDGIHHYKLEVFWSWKAAFHGDREIAVESVLNIILLLPAGVLLPFMFARKLSWRWGLAAGVFISAVIETCQLISCRGLFEVDDIIHNGTGCMFGCVIGSMLISDMKKLKLKKIKRIRT